jgi:NADH-quinone oxidoreductase subunit M
MIPFPWLSIIIFLPLVGGLVVLALYRYPQQCRWVSLWVTLADLAMVVGLLLTGYRSRAMGDWLVIEDYEWIERFGIRYSLGLDGISLVLILLTTFLSVMCVLVSWRQIEERVSGFHFFLLAMQTGVLGVFLATDLFLFYLFWELQLIPMFFIIGIWGHENRIYATVKFVLFSITGSLLMLIAVIGLYIAHGSQTGNYTFSLFHLTETLLTRNAEMWLYAAFLLAFAIKIPVFPVHTWLPDAHTEAPTAGSVILAGLLLKTGAYALLRFAFPLFPGAAKQSVPLLLALGLIGLFYAAWIALAQKDMKRLVAYSSISHMGLIVIGLAIWSKITLSGAVLQMVNHGLTTSALFILVGMLDERAHTRNLADFGGLWKKMPVFSAFFLLFAMASLGLPGLNSFVGEILILVGTFRERPLVGALGFAGIVFILIYVLRLVQDSLFGEAKGERVLRDVDAREAAVLIPLAIAVLWIGLYPRSILDLLQGPVHTMVAEMGKMIIPRSM